MVEKTQSKDQRKRPVLLVVFSISIIILSLYNLGHKAGLGMQHILSVIQDAPFIFIEFFILQGILSLFAGVGMLMLNSTARIVAVLLAINNLGFYISSILPLPVDSSLEKIQISDKAIIAYCLILAVYQIIFIFYISRNKIKDKFYAGSSDTTSVLIRSGFVMIVFFLVVMNVAHSLKGTIVTLKKEIPTRISKLKLSNLPGQKKIGGQRISSLARVDSNKNKGLKVDGIIYDKDYPSVMIDRKVYQRNDSISGGIIMDISRGEVIIKFPDREETYSVGEVIQFTDRRTEVSLDIKPAISSK
ncbi:MAG: hypothetical protein ABIH27_06655 [Candidatus Omnitrophota bacterium]